MRVGTVAQIGDPDPAVRAPSLTTLTAPASDRLCDAAVVAFALWTVCCHAVVAAGRALLALLALYAVVLIAALLLRRRVRAEPPLSVATSQAGPPGPTLGILRIASLIAGVAAALTFTARPDVFWWIAVVVLGLAAVAVCVRDAVHIPAAEHERWAEIALWLLAATVVVVTLISHRPDTDDAFYVDVAVSTADVPQRALLSVDTMHGIEGLPLHLSVYRVDSYELLNGALSYLSRIPALYCFHWVSAAIAALLVPLAHARFFRILTPRRWLATTATLVFILVAAGETHRWYGNFAFVRMWQGKGIFLFVFLPLVYAYALRFAVRPTRRDWLMLAAAEIAAVGCSSSALWVAPAGALMALCAAVRPSARGLQRVFVGALASAYVLGAAWIARASLEGVMSLPAASSTNQVVAPASPLYGAVATILGDARLLLFGLVAVVTAWVFAPAGLARRFAVVCPLVVLLALLNPYFADLVPQNITGPAFWRTMWALPLPILMALMLTWPLNLGGGSSWPAVRFAAWGILLAGFAVLIPAYSGLSAANGVRLSWPTLKVPDAAYQMAVAVNESVPPRSYVDVPSEIDPWIVTLHHHVYPLLVRGYLHPGPDRLSWEELTRRARMRSFLDTPELVEATPEQFRNGLDRFDVRAVCLVNTPKADAARAVLRQDGFHQTLRRDDYELWVRTGAERTSHDPGRHHERRDARALLAGDASGLERGEDGRPGDPWRPANHPGDRRRRGAGRRRRQ